MGDIEDGFAGMSDGQKKAAAGCGGLLILLLFIFFCIMMSAFHHLGPDDQVLIKTSRGHRVVNGPMSGQFNPFQEKTWRKATMIDPLQYAIMQDRMTAELRSEEGPQLLFLKAYDELKEVLPKLVLEKDEFVRLIDSYDGTERVEKGPRTIVPKPTEKASKGIEKAVFLNMDSSVVIRNKTNGMLTLVTSCNYQSGVYTPAPMEDIVEIRRLIHVLPHEALIVRDVNGRMKVYGGNSDAGDAGNSSSDSDQDCFATQTQGAGTAFFLPPYSKIVRMSWSSYTSPGTAAIPSTRRLQTIPVADEKSLYVDQMQATTHSGPKIKVAAIDLRTQKSFYKYEVRTADNVKLELEGTIFWRVENIQDMIKMTSDPAGDVWAHARSTLIGVISDNTLADFMVNFNTLMGVAFNRSTTDDFYTRRGIVLTNLELTKYAPVDEHTKTVLQNIIRQTVNRINDLQKQRSRNDVALEKLTMDIALEENRTRLIETEATNSRLLAEQKGTTAGTKEATSIAFFIEGLNETVPNATDRMGLFKQEKILESTNKDTQQLSSGEASLYVAPKDMELRLQMPHEASHAPEL